MKTEICRLKVIELSVTKDGESILSGVSFEARGGEITALIGRNGAGKTTLLRALLGRIPHEGKVICTDKNGNVISKPTIGYVPQSLYFDPYAPVTVSDLLCTSFTAAPVWLIRKKAAREQAFALLENVGGGDLLDKPLRALSGGEMQRVLFAFALRPVPDLLLLDEPVSAVDTIGIEVFYENVAMLKREFRMPVLLVSHNLSHIKKFASSSVLLDKTVLQSGPTEQVVSSKAFAEAFGLI